MRFVVSPGGVPSGTLVVPGDKSVSHRAVMLGAVAEGETRVSGLLEGDDVLATVAAFKAMGVQVEGPRAGEARLQGVGLRGLRAPEHALDLGNSGTAMRLLAGLLAGQRFATCLTGDESLSKRPMQRVTVPLTQMGAQIETSDGGTPPLRIAPASGPLKAVDYASPVASAQVKSCVLLAGLYAAGRTCVSEPAVTRDHTERMLQAFGYELQSTEAAVCLAGGGVLRGCDIAVPGDVSSAAFFMVGAAMTPGAEVVLQGVGVNPTRTGVVEILRQMGANIGLENQRLLGAEPVADIRVRGAPLRGIAIPPALVPLAIDEFPVLFVAAAAAQGETVLSGAAELRVKESDRIAVMADGLQRLGVDARATVDGMVIRGGPIGGGEVHSHGDHRVAMAFAIAGLRAERAISIDDCTPVSTSFPGFVEVASAAGLNVEATA